MKILYGNETKKALKNFPVSGLKPDPAYVRACLLIKKAAAETNFRLKLLSRQKYQAIERACDLLLRGKYQDQFVVDPYQAGAGTSHHMNINEVIANLASVHAHDDVNMSQSTNDVIPAAIRLAVLFVLPGLISSLKKTESNFRRLEKQGRKIFKPGRTHLRDALPLTFAQEFSGYKKALASDLKRIINSGKDLQIIGLGGTAVGTGANSHPLYAKIVVSELKKISRLPIRTADNLFEAMQNATDFLNLSAALRNLAQNLVRIGNDLRLLSSGPGTGLNEIILLEVQKGSSIMPGKINPSIIEMLTMVSFQIIGLDTAILQASMAGQLELNVFFPLIEHNLLSQLRLLTNALNVFNIKCLAGLKFNQAQASIWLTKSLGTAAMLNRAIGYERGAELVKEAQKKGLSVIELAVKKGYLNQQKAKEIFNYERTK